MKARGPLFLLVCALVALALPANAASRNTQGITLSSFEVEDSNGYEIEFAAIRDNKQRPIAAVSAQQQTASASYQVRTAPGAGIHATFGSLRQVDVSFQRRKKMVDRPERNCRWIIEAGVFRGSFRFTGEGGYITSEAVNPKGVVFRLPDGFCGFGSFRPILPPGVPSETILAARGKTDAGEVSFHASRPRIRRGPTLFTVSTQERVEGVEIERSLRVPGQRGDFTATGTSRAAVTPPLPFSGSARFRDPRRGSPTWEGTLAAPLPGLEEITLAGESFSARLCPHASILVECLSRGDRSPNRSFYGSGSHSQPLALARLSSLR